MHSRGSYGQAHVAARALYAVPLQFLELWWIPRTIAVTVAQGRFNILKCHKMALTDSEAPRPGRPCSPGSGSAMAAGALWATWGIFYELAGGQLHSAVRGLF